MRIKRFIITLLITLFIFDLIPKATPNRPIPTATTFKQGIYDTSDYAGYLAKLKLVSPDKPVTIIVLDASGMQKSFLTLNKTKEEAVAGPANKGDIFVVVGPGEVSVSDFK